MSEPDESLAELFWSVARRLRHSSAETLAPYDLAPSHARALSVLLRHGTMRLSALSDHLHIAPRSATEVVDALESRGLAQRSPDPDDRRATLVSLTAGGSTVGAAIASARADEARRYFGRLSAGDDAHLRRILKALAAEADD